MMKIYELRRAGQKLTKTQDFAYGRYGMRKLGFFQQKL